MTLEEAAKTLGVARVTLMRFAHRYGIGRKVPREGRGRPWRMEFSREDVAALQAARRDAFEKKSEAAAALCRERNQTANPGHFSNRKKQAAAWDRQDYDYYGEIHAFDGRPTAVDDPELSSQLPGGPQFVTLQWRAFYPRFPGAGQEDLSAWATARGNILEHASLDAGAGQLFLDRAAVRLWNAQNRRS